MISIETLHMRTMLVENMLDTLCRNNMIYDKEISDIFTDEELILINESLYKLVVIFSKKLLSSTYADSYKKELKAKIEELF